MGKRKNKIYMGSADYENKTIESDEKLDGKEEQKDKDIKMNESGKQSDWKKEQKRKDFPWGWPSADHKSLIAPITKSDSKSGSYVISYDNVKRANGVLEPNAKDEVTGQMYHTQLYASRPYRPMNNSTSVERLTCEELEKINFGIKQKGPMYFNNKDGQASYTLSDHVDGKDTFDDFKNDNEETTLKNNSLHGMALNKTAVNRITNKPKCGLGPKFYNRGANSCINAIVTRYDCNGNVQMMAMLRPQDAASDPGDYQMSAGCIFFAEDMKFNEINIKGMTSTPYDLEEDDSNIDEKGKIRGKYLAYARAAIYSKLWHGKQFIPMIETWDFDNITTGIVDDVSNTSQSWVETHYNVHHVTGYEEEEELAMMMNAEVNKKRANVGFGVWRNIDPDPKDPNNVYSQLYVKNEAEVGSDEYISHYAKHEGAAQKYDPFAEFDMWHGEHAFVARLVSDYVKKKYKFEGPVDDINSKGKKKSTSSFGKCHVCSEEDTIIDDEDGWSQHPSLDEELGFTEHPLSLGKSDAGERKLPLLYLVLGIALVILFVCFLFFI